MVKEGMKLAIKCNEDGEEIINSLISWGYKNYNNLTGEHVNINKDVYYSVGYDNIIHCIISTVGVTYVFDSLKEAKKFINGRVISIKISDNNNGKEIVSFLEYLGYKRNGMCGDATPDFYYRVDIDGLIWASADPEGITFNSLEEAKKYYGMKEEKELKIQIPEGYEIDKENSTFECIKFKRKELTYDDIAKELFHEKELSYINQFGEINTTTSLEGEESFKCPNNCTSRTQAEKLLAINKLMNVAKYLNKGWIPNWKDNEERKYHIIIDSERLSEPSKVSTDYGYSFNGAVAYFASESNAMKAIEILGEDTIKLALVSDY